MDPLWLLVAQVASTWAMVGLIWSVQVVQYPLFASVGAGFRAYHQGHMDRIGWVVGPLMLTEAGSALLLWLEPPAGTSAGPWLAGLALLAVIWLETALFAVPQHGRLGTGFDAGTHRRLVAGNLVRALVWTARGGLVAWVLLGLLAERVA